MRRRDLLKLSPAALAVTAGHVAWAEAQTPQHGTGGEAVYNVRHFGATGDGKTVDTPAINRAIEAVNAKGGGTLVFPAGTYMCFTIRLKSNVELYLSSGCTIVAADSPKPGDTTGYNGGVYDKAEPNEPWTPYQDYGHNHWRNSLLYAEKEHDFAVTGPGLIWGKGLSRGYTAAPGYDTFVAEQAGVGNKTFGLKNCHNVILRDFAMLKGGHFALLATGVDNLILENLLVDTDRDGFDIDCCRNVRVSNCTMNSPWDDGICPKSSYALGYPRSTDNVTISNNYVTGWYELGSVIGGTWKRFPDDAHVPRNGRIKCGTESDGGFRNITITGNVIEGSKGIALESADGAYLEDIAITGNSMRHITDMPLFLRLNRRERRPPATVRPGRLRRILISNLVSSHANGEAAALFSGIPSNLIEDVKVANCYLGHEGMPAEIRSHGGMKPMPDWRTIQVPEEETEYPGTGRFGPTPSQGFFVRHLRNLEMSHVEIAPEGPDPRPAFWLEDVHRADFFAITAPGEKNFSLHDVTSFRLLWSRAGKDADIADAKDEMV